MLKQTRGFVPEGPPFNLALGCYPALLGCYLWTVHISLPSHLQYSNQAHCCATREIAGLALGKYWLTPVKLRAWQAGPFHLVQNMRASVSQTVLDRIAHQFGHRTHLQFAHQITAVPLDSLNADIQLDGNLSAGIAMRHPAQDLLLARR